MNFRKQISKVAVRPESCKVELKERGRLEDEDSGDEDDNDEDEDDDDVGLAEEEEEEEEETFLVCVHNVSPEIPYAILKGRVTDTAKDILLQALLKVQNLFGFLPHVGRWWCAFFLNLQMKLN